MTSDHPTPPASANPPARLAAPATPPAAGEAPAAGEESGAGEALAAASALRLPERASIYIDIDGTVHFGALFEGLVPVAEALRGRRPAGAKRAREHEEDGEGHEPIDGAEGESLERAAGEVCSPEGGARADGSGPERERVKEGAK